MADKYTELAAQAERGELDVIPGTELQESPELAERGAAVLALLETGAERENQKPQSGRAPMRDIERRTSGLFQVSRNSKRVRRVKRRAGTKDMVLHLNGSVSRVLHTLGQGHPNGVDGVVTDLVTEYVLRQSAQKQTSRTQDGSWQQ